VLLQNKVALVTGGASGLGARTARLFAAHGAEVVIADVDDARGESVAAEVRRDGGTATYQHVDVRSTDDVNAAVAFAEATYGSLHIAVANAGILGDGTFRVTEDVSDEQWGDIIDINLSGVFRTFRAAIPALRRAGGGALSATSSVSSQYAVLHAAAYCASKAGVNALVRALAVELAPARIRVNAICPGVMKTGIGDSLGRTTDEIAVERPSRRFKSRVIQAGREGAEEAARVHLFLCSDLAAYVNGETITVDGGFSMWNGM
jgi:NAD(P)-dependent dehydrogenase (short-subunit alcohol dehydrogenase family)